MNSSDDFHWFSGICDTPFWDYNRTWNTHYPQFSPCMLDTVLTWAPTALLWLVFPYQLYDYMTANRQLIRPNYVNRTKLYLGIVYYVISALQLGMVCTDFASKSTAEILAAFCNFFSTGLLLTCIHFQRIYGFINSGLGFFFIVFKLLVSIVSIPTILNDDDYLTYGQKLVWFGKFVAEIILFFALSFADKIDDRSMFQEESQSPICSKDTSSIPSKLTFWWFNSLVFLGAKKSLSMDDLWRIRAADKAKHLFQTFNKFWGHESSVKQQKDEIMFGDEQAQPAKINVFSVLWRIHRIFFIFPCAARFFTDNLLLVNPLIMERLIQFANDSDAPLWQGFFYAFFFVVTNTLATFVNSYQQHRMSVLALRIRNTLIASIYRKSLSLSAESRKKFTSGEIVNMIAVDSQRFTDLLPWINFLWTAPVQIAISLWLLYAQLGPSVFGGLLIMILTIPATFFAGRMVKDIQQNQMKQKDSRLKMISELLNGMKVVKLYAWESAFVKNIEKIRSNELAFIRKSSYYTTIYNLISVSSPFMVSFVTFAIYVLSDSNNVLTAQKAFVSIALFNMLRVPLKMIPNLIYGLVLVMVSMKRITRFLNAEEVLPYIEKVHDDQNALKIVNGTFSWDSNSVDEDESDDEDMDDDENNDRDKKKEEVKRNSVPQITLSNINLTIAKGSLVAIVGSVGSGKSSLIHALLGEMQKLSGTVAISNRQRIAYIAQQAWIQNETVKGNIIFGSEYQELKYRRVIDACALKQDLKMLTDGDLTEIGEKGINLSGGQEQRVSIARACYSDSDFYLFDDPLSAVDSHVGKHIFDKVLSSETGILKGKTRVLVTNALYMLPNVDNIVLLKDGRVEAAGSYEELIKNCQMFSDWIENYVASNSESEEEKSVSEGSDDSFAGNDGLKKNSITKITTNRQDSRLSSHSVQSIRERTQTSTSAMSNKLQTPAKLIEAEGMAVGNVTLDVYKKFFGAMSMPFSILMMFCYFMVICSNLSSNMWIAAWTDTAVSQLKSIGYYLGIYMVTGVAEALFVCVGWFFVIQGTIRASRNLHSNLLNTIVRAPMHFFDVTPIGRIINRFSKDIDVLDTNMPLLLRILFNTAFQVLGTLFLLSFKQPVFLVVAIPFVILYFFVQRFYVQTTRQLKRLESISRSPIFSHFSETISGVCTIKAYQVTERFIGESDSRIDENQRCLYPTFVSNCWLQVRLEMMANCLVFFAAIFAALSKNWAHKLSGSDTGLSLSYALNVSLYLNFCVRMFADLENNVVSVERISEYTAVEPEGDWHTEEDKRLSLKWPENGAIKLDAYATRYRPGLELVLKRVDLDIEKGVKIGIVGRTGAGKSSLTLALFRIIEASNGKISIDNVDISKIGLQKLRSNITIIPQDPVLFAGTIRTNLDPFNNFTDSELWSALEHSHLKSFVTGLDAGLEYQISEAGENLSVGQRQLICLARALLRKKKILVMDEATSGVDLETDCLIQNTIKQEFSDCTILTIAHRLNTIMDSDRVLVLDAGQVAEYDSPQVLLANNRSIFYSLAKDAGIVS